MLGLILLLGCVPGGTGVLLWTGLGWLGLAVAADVCGSIPLILLLVCVSSLGLGWLCSLLAVLDVLMSRFLSVTVRVVGTGAWCCGATGVTSGGLEFEWQ